MAPRGPVGARDVHKVFVRGTTGLREADLSSTFSTFGEIVSIRSHSKGYSFVTFETTKGAADSLGVTRVKDQAVECHLAWMQETPIPNLQNANLPPRPGSWGGYGARDELRLEGGRNRVEGDDHGSRRGQSRSRSRDRHRRRSTSGSRERRRRREDDRDSGRRERRRRRSRSRSGSPGHRRRRDRVPRDRSELDGSPRERRRSHSPRRRRHSRSRSPRRRRSSSLTRSGSPSQSLRGSSTKSRRSRARSRDPLTPQSEFGAESRDGGRKSGRSTSLERAREGEDGDGDTRMERNGEEEEEPPATAPFVDETCCLAVRNLSKVCTADSLHSLASECGQVASAVVHHYYTGEGMLVYETAAEAEEALRMLNGRQLHGLTLRLQRP